MGGTGRAQRRLRPGGPRACGRAHGQFLSAPCYVLPQRSFLHGTRTDARQDRLQKRRQRFPRRDDVAALQAAADRLSPTIIRKRLDHRTLILGPKFSKKERSETGLSRFYSIARIEYCRNFIFKRHFPIHQTFERSCGQPHQRDLRRPPQQKDERETGHCHRPDRTRPPRVPRLLEARLTSGAEKWLCFVRG